MKEGGRYSRWREQNVQRQKVLKCPEVFMEPGESTVEKVGVLGEQQK